MAEYDLIIRNATIVDGTGKPGYLGSVGVRGDRIIAVGTVDGQAACTIDGTGLTLTPGFIDGHSHLDLNIIDYPLAENMIMQGCTTVVGGNCGHSRAPVTDPKYKNRWMEFFWTEVECSAPTWHTMSEYLDTIERTRISVNLGMQVGHGALRVAALGDDFKRKASPDEVGRMKTHLREAMDAGAYGMSGGIDYEGEYADPETEVVELCKVVKEYDGVFHPHTRHADYRWPVEDPNDFGYGRCHEPEDAWNGRYHGLIEAVETARRSGVRLVVGHIPPLYAVYAPHPDYLESAIARATVDIIAEQPRKEGMYVALNTYPIPCTAGSRSPILGSLYSTLMKPPAWLASLTPTQLVESLKTREFRDKMKKLAFSGTYKFGMLPPRIDPYWGDCFRVGQCKVKEYEGKTIGELARARSPHWTMDALFEQATEVVFDIVIADPDAMWDAIWDKRQDPMTLATILKDPFGFPLVDASSCPAKLDPASPLPPPSYYGLFPSYLDMFVKQRKDFTLEEAIHHTTQVPAEVMRLRDRGVIRVGGFADLTLFDFGKLRLCGTFGKPNTPTEGMELVVVNGKIALEKNRLTSVRSGHVLRRG